MGMYALAYNRRGHDILSILNSRDVEGGALQLTSEAVADNTCAREWLLEKATLLRFVLDTQMVGCLRQNMQQLTDTPALILLSPHIGGKKMLPIAS